MSQSQNFSKYIKGLTKDQFDEIIKIYIHIRFNVSESAIVDGKGDGGIDIKIFEHNVARKIPLQITVEERAYRKLEKDLKKVAKLIAEKGYSSSFYFFYSRGAAETKESELTQLAKDQFDISLEIIDCDVLSGAIQTAKYTLVKEKLLMFLGPLLTQNDKYFNDFDKMKFDLLSYGSESIELKSKFIESFILYSLLSAPDFSLDTKQITDEIKREFGDAIDIGLCQRQCKKLASKGKVSFSGSLNDRVTLESEVALTLQTIVDSMNLQEQEFINSINALIKKFLDNTSAKDIIDNLIDVLKTNYLKDQQEINQDVSGNGEKDSLIRLRKFLNTHINNSEKIEDLIGELTNLSSGNDFLQKVCAGNLFKELISSTEFDSYRRRTNKTVVIDTPVLIPLFLVLYEPNYDYTETRYQVAKHLYKLVRSNDESLKFITTDKYIEETSNYLINAIKLCPVIELGIFDKLGGSTNSIVRFYNDMVDSNYLSLSFSDFIIDMGVNFQMFNDRDLERYVKEYLHRLFEDNGVEVLELQDFDRDYSTQKTYEDILENLKSVYRKRPGVRSSNAAKNDALLLSSFYCEGQSDEDVQDPILITWDNTFSEFRKKYHIKHPKAKYWHLFRPAKFLDHFSLLNFQINSEAFNLDLISINEDEFNVNKQITKLNDVLVKIVNMQTAEGTKLTKGLAEIRKEYIYNLAGKEASEESFIETQPVDELIEDLSYYFNDKNAKNNFSQFKRAFKNEDFVDSFLDYIKSEMTYYSEHKQYKTSVNKETDLLIDKFK
jgi:hypothetical protein